VGKTVGSVRSKREWNLDAGLLVSVIVVFLGNNSAPHRNRDCDKMFSVGQNAYFSQWLQSEMDKRDWSQSDCARAADLNRAVINKLLNGKCRPQPATLMAIARALRIPVETAYRAAGLLPPSPNADDITTELMYIFNSIQSPQRRMTAMTLLRALVLEEENENRGRSREKQ
jgi:transcriptional regulator with XRE-family HTH domain